MKHSITELYKIEGDEMHIYSAEAVKNTPKKKPHQSAKKGECYSLIYKVYKSKPFRIYDKIGSKEFRLGYLYGEHAYFDSEEEREAYRKQIAEIPSDVNITVEREGDFVKIKGLLGEILLNEHEAAYLQSKIYQIRKTFE